MTTRERDTSTNVSRIDGSGVIHAIARSENTIGLRVLFCNGRAVRGFVATNGAATCRSCLKALKAQGQEPTVDRRTHESSYGREPITVDALVPTRSVDHHLDRIHVGTPLSEVLDETREQIEQVSMGPEGPLWTPERIAETLAYTEWRHLENRAEYAWVMGSH